MNNLKKLLAGLLALVMVLGLAACGNQETPGTTPSGDAAEEAPESEFYSLGSITLVGATQLVLHYDAEGKIMTIADPSGNAYPTDLSGTACAEAVVQIVKASDGPFAEHFVLIKQNPDTLVPNEDFLNDILEQAQKALGDLPVILSPAATQDEHGYFAPETAEAILTACLNNPEGAVYGVTSTPEDGYYQISVSTETGIENYSVGALYGSVELVTEPNDELEADTSFMEDPIADDSAAVEPTEDNIEVPADENMDAPENEMPTEPEEIIG